MMTQTFDIFRMTITSGGPYAIIAIAFVAGVATSFTPCLYPMIPITMGILQTQAVRSVWSNFLTALSYVVGMAIVYACLGYVAAASTLIFGKWATNPWVILVVVAIFLYLAFSMFGLYEVRLPAFLVKHHDVGGTARPGVPVRRWKLLLKSFIFGAVSGTVASPCLTPPLAVLLTMVAKRGNPLFGGVVLFAFALGMGMLLLVVGTFSTSLAFLPRAGNWMLGVKKFFGFVLLAACVYIARPVIGDVAAMYLYGSVALAAVIYYIIVIFRRSSKT